MTEKTVKLLGKYPIRSKAIGLQGVYAEILYEGDWITFHVNSAGVIIDTEGKDLPEEIKKVIIGKVDNFWNSSSRLP